MVEFTIPWEQRTEEFHEWKKAKYQYLADSWRESSWKTAVFIVVICCKFSISISIENAGDISGRAWKTGPRPRKTAQRASSLALASTQRTKLEANVFGRGSDWSPLPVPPPRECTEHKGGGDIWWRMGTQMMASTFGSDIYKTTHVIVLQT